MAQRPDTSSYTSSYTSFDQIIARLDEIVGEVRKRDLPLESSLDLFDEAVALGAKAVDFVDTAAVTAEEELRAQAASDAAAREDEVESETESDATRDPEAGLTDADEA